MCKYVALLLMDMLDCSLKNLQLVGTAFCVYRTQINTFIIFNFKVKVNFACSSKSVCSNNDGNVLTTDVYGITKIIYAKAIYLFN